MNHPRILTGFTFTSDEGIVDEVLFTINSDDTSGIYLDWDIREHVVETHIPGTNYTYIESLGFALATVTWGLDFEHASDYYRFVKFLGKSGTLKVLADAQSLKGERVDGHMLGVHYELLDHTRIAAIGQSPHFVDGHVECDVAFSRAVDPVTRLAVWP